MASETASPMVGKALRKASRLAFTWPEEATTLLATGRSLTEFTGVGPYLEKVIEGWVEKPPTLSSPPPIREGFLTLTEARKVLAAKPGWPARLKGDLQMHTEWSDGSGTIAQMAEAAAGRGYEYIAITDHAKGLKIAGGINEKELLQQRAEIGRVNAALQTKALPLQVLRSIEVNLNPRGESDLEEAALTRLDIVLGCFHSSLRKQEDQTDRYLAALRNPSIQILGHPRGRIYNYRLGLAADWPRVFSLAAELDKAVEIDSYPDRQDLNVGLLRQARKAGCKISIGTDAHHPPQLAFIELGLAAALLADLPAERVLHFLPRERLLSWAQEVRQTR